MPGSGPEELGFLLCVSLLLLLCGAMVLAMQEQAGTPSTHLRSLAQQVAALRRSAAAAITPSHTGGGGGGQHTGRRRGGRRISRAEAAASVSSLRKLLNRPVSTTPQGFVTVQKVLFTPKKAARRQRTEELVGTLAGLVGTRQDVPPRAVAQLAERCSNGKSACKTARSHGAVGVFAALLRSSADPVVQEHCCHGIATMIALDGRPSVQALQEEDTPRALAHLANDSYVATLREAAAWALTALAIKGGAEGYHAVDRHSKGGVQPVLDVLCQAESQRRIKRRDKQGDAAVVLQSLCRCHAARLEMRALWGARQSHEHAAASKIQRVVRERVAQRLPHPEAAIPPGEVAWPSTTAQPQHESDDPLLGELGLQQYAEQLKVRALVVSPPTQF